MAYPDCRAEGGGVEPVLAKDTWLVPQYTEDGFLSYVATGTDSSGNCCEQVGKQQHPGNGAGFEIDDDGVRSVAQSYRYSVARTRRGYCCTTPASCVYSVTCGMRQAYGATEFPATGAQVPDLNRGAYENDELGPYKFTTD